MATETNPIHPQSLMQAAELCQAVVEEVGKVFIGNPGLTQGLLIGLLSRSHILLEGVPGVAKTTLAKGFAQVLAVTSSASSLRPIRCRRTLLGRTS